MTQSSRIQKTPQKDAERRKSGLAPIDIAPKQIAHRRKPAEVALTDWCKSIRAADSPGRIHEDTNVSLLVGDVKLWRVEYSMRGGEHPQVRVAIRVRDFF